MAATMRPAATHVANTRKRPAASSAKGTRNAVFGFRSTSASAIPAARSRRTRPRRHASTTPAATSGTTWPRCTACITHHGVSAAPAATQRTRPAGYEIHLLKGHKVLGVDLRPTLLQPDTCRSLIGVEVDAYGLAAIPEIESEGQQHDDQRKGHPEPPHDGHA